MASIRAGDASAWDTLVSRYQSRLYTLCYRMTGHRELAADVCQDAFLKIIQGLDSYDGRAQLATWMTRITINACLSRLRSEKLRRHTSLDLELTGSSADSTMGGPLWRSVAQIREPEAGEGVDTNEDRARLQWALGQLDPEQRAIILLRDQRGLDYEQIGEVLSIAIGTVKSRLFRARAALREVLERQEKAFLPFRAPGHPGDTSAELSGEVSDPNDSLS